MLDQPRAGLYRYHVIIRSTDSGVNQMTPLTLKSGFVMTSGKAWLERLSYQRRPEPMKKSLLALLFFPLPTRQNLVRLPSIACI